MTKIRILLSAGCSSLDTHEEADYTDGNAVHKARREPMAIAEHNRKSAPLTYEQYKQEGEVNRRYDIIDGMRIDMANPTRRHQAIAGNIYDALRNYERSTGSGKAFFAPCDLLITRVPLRTRQPDVLFISHQQLSKCGADTDPTALEAAPELVVEILSPTETRRIRDGKIADYCAIGVKECWVVHTMDQTVEVLRLNPKSADTVALYGSGQTVQSALFPALTIAVTAVFAA
jgi:Uma2 family endonuclease